jgi:sugar/nucleoside kinase (ribokinase family)
VTPRPVALVVGHVTLDVAPDAAVPGGSAYYAAHALAGLGADVRVLTSAGPDFPPGALHAARGRLVAHVVSAPGTTRFLNVAGTSGRRSQRVLAAARPLHPADLPAGWLAPDLLLLAPVVGELHPGALLRAVRARVVGLCVQGLVRDVRPDGEVAPRRLDPAGLAGIDAAFLGDDEAAGQPDLPDLLADALPVVAWTHGARGSEVRAGGRTVRVGVHPAREVDPTGAGDVYAAAFLLALAGGAEPDEAARLGAAAASIAVEGRGGDALPRIGDAFARAAAVRVG